MAIWGNFNVMVVVKTSYDHKALVKMRLDFNFCRVHIPGTYPSVSHIKLVLRDEL